MKRMIIAFIALMASVLPAMAQWEAKVSRPFQTGVYLGLNGGYQVGASELDLNATGMGSILNLDGLSSRGAIYGVHGGFDFRIAGTPWLVGLVGSYQFGESEFDISTGLGGGINILNATIEPTWKAGLRGGYVFGNGTLAYAGYQYANAELNITSGLASGSISRDLTGHDIFAGIEIPVTDFVTVGLQYDWTRYNTEDLLDCGGCGARLDLDTDVHAVTARVNVRLQGMFGQ